MLSSSSLKIAEKAKGQSEKKVIDQMNSSCAGDLKSFDTAYYGVPIKFGSEEAAAKESGEVSLVPLTFLGPIGTLVSAIASILEPIFIDAATILDEQKREAAVVTALNDNAEKIEGFSRQLAATLDTYSKSQRRNLAGQFNETLTTIRHQVIDLSKEDSCRKLSEANRLADGEPSSQFVQCWRFAGAQMQPQVINLAKIGDDYDALADISTQKANDQLNTILKAYKQISSGTYAPTNVFWDDVTQFLGLVNAIKAAASASNKKTLDTDLKAVAK